MVNIVHRGTTYPARALVEPAIEASFITGRLLSTLGIETNSTQAITSEFNQAVPTTSRKLCSLRIGPSLHASLIKETLLLKRQIYV